MKKHISILLVSFLFCAPYASSGQVYKWVDEAGNVHYSDKKPSSVEADQIKVSGGQASASRQNPVSQSAAQEEAKQKALEEKAEALQAASQKEQTQKICEQIRANLQTLNEKSRIKIEEEGQQRYLSPEEIEEKKSNYQEQLDKHCQ